MNNSPPQLQSHHVTLRIRGSLDRVDGHGQKSGMRGRETTTGGRDGRSRKGPGKGISRTRDCVYLSRGRRPTRVSNGAGDTRYARKRLQAIITNLKSQNPDWSDLFKIELYYTHVRYLSIFRCLLPARRSLSEAMCQSNVALDPSGSGIQSRERPLLQSSWNCQIELSGPVHQWRRSRKERSVEPHSLDHVTCAALFAYSLSSGAYQPPIKVLTSQRPIECPTFNVQHQIWCQAPTLSTSHTFR